MRSFTTCIRVVGFLVLQISFACFGQSAYPPASLPVSMTAQDATYTVRLPLGWQLAATPMLEYGLVFGPQGESFVMGLNDVYLDQSVLWRVIDPGYRAILSPERFALKSRMFARPMGPLQVVTTLLPQLANGSMQNVRVLRALTGPNDLGFSQMFIIYQYTLLPQVDWPAASQANPAVRVMGQVQMEAAAYIVTFPYTGQLSWQLGYRILSAPRDVFQRNWRIYAQILESFRVIPEGLRRKIQSNEDRAKLADSMNRTTQQIGENWGSELGANSEPGGTETASGGPRCYEPNLSGPYDVAYCCQEPGGGAHWKYVPKSQDLPPPGYSPLACKKIDGPR